MVKMDIEVKSGRSNIETACVGAHEALLYGPGPAQVQVTKSQAEQARHTKDIPHNAQRPAKRSSNKGAQQVWRIIHPANGSPELICFLLLLVALLVCLVIWA